jgi:hypothetical protein
MLRSPLICTLLSLIALGGCAAGDRTIPSLATRAAETIDPRVPIPDRVDSSPADAAFGATLRQLVTAGRSGTGRFDQAMATAERLASSAGLARSESWIAAQEALSAAVAERYSVTAALAEIDALAAQRVAARGGMSPADQQQLDDAAAALSPIDARQAARIDAVQRRLGA